LVRIAVCIAAVVLAGCISGPLAAQTAADIASDQELLAAYCLGREQQGLKDWSLIDIASASVLPSGEKDTALLSLDERIKRDYAHEIDRLQAFLRAHGLGIAGVRSNVANTGMTNAILRGRADEASCSATIHDCVKACTKPKPIGYDKECTKSCSDDNPACPAMRRCVPDAVPP
jgi:hypothetical protein